MMNQTHLKEWIRSNCPFFWSSLSKNAQATVPRGLVEYATTGTPSEIEEGKDLKAVEKYLTELATICSVQAVRDTYRKDFSGSSG